MRTRAPERRILEGTAARAALLRGMDVMTRLIRPTLGPLPRMVAIRRLVGSEPPEVLDSGATIARRTIQLADPFEDMGGMLVRNLAWRVFERSGDGTATATVLAHCLADAGLKYVAAGGNPVSVRGGLEHGLIVALAQLRQQARPIDGPAEIASVIGATLGDTELSEMLGEVVDAVGPDGAVLVEDAQQTHTTHEYLDGVRWNEGYVSPFLLGNDEATTARVMNPRVLVTDQSLERAEQLLPTLEACIGAGERNLLVVAPEIKDSAVALLALNRERGVLERVVGVRAPAVGTQRLRILEDLAVITGGRCFSRDRGDRLAEVAIEDLGQARQAWATRFAFGILGGRGSKAAIRQRIGEVKAELLAVESHDVYTREKIQERIGKLAGTTAIIHVGAATNAAQADLKLRVEAAVKSARAALREGVVPGGGAALVACVPALEAMVASGDEAVGVRALVQAMNEPMRAIVDNAGFEAEPIVARARACRLAYDVIRREWVDVWRDGPVDPLAVVLEALESSVSTAAMVLTADVLIRRRRPPVATNP